ncbi:1307_t:CDS:2 [Funneliformis geosporum]|uniref:valine--tRNA ligase n=1 Tax=Funneliformis geosporum TaxID=1117311 RepID=A0A9W4S9J4_9GLOM|nr:1307_t:CDS:2 [Funneliformis geosporum]
MDHAGISTQSKIENLNLAELDTDEKKRKYTFQTCFTLDPAVQKQVREAFVKLYQDGLIYQGHEKNCCGNNDEKIFDYISPSGEKRGKSRRCQKHWELCRKIRKEEEKLEKDIREKNRPCPRCNSFFAPGGWNCLATSRPETIFADVALFVNPDDQQFGSGILKCTPGHDFTDYELGKKYQLPLISCCDEKGILNGLAGQWQGKEIGSIREELVRELEKRDICGEIKDYETNLASSAKSGALVEPLLSRQ